ncbi:hypothetical protein PG994_003410 [Apiospora phragmitis]|uniref:Uncharacterized protein n=1 Tax=Apiospora phragmitis TaxID=2905665 RepID=A0ABR1VY32_9PEZI
MLRGRPGQLGPGLLQYDAIVGPVFCVVVVRQNRLPVLHHAATYGLARLARRTLEAGADVDQFWYTKFAKYISDSVLRRHYDPSSHGAATASEPGAVLESRAVCFDQSWNWSNTRTWQLGNTFVQQAPATLACPKWWLRPPDSPTGTDPSRSLHLRALPEQSTHWLDPSSNKVRWTPLHLAAYYAAPGSAPPRPRQAARQSELLDLLDPPSERIDDKDSHYEGDGDAGSDTDAELECELAEMQADKGETAEHLRQVIRIRGDQTTGEERMVFHHPRIVFDDLPGDDIIQQLLRDESMWLDCGGDSIERDRCVGCSGGAALGSRALDYKLSLVYWNGRDKESRWNPSEQMGI